MDIVNFDRRFLLRLDALREHQMYLDVRKERIVHKVEGDFLTLYSTNGHLFYIWDFGEILYTRPELDILYMQFFHHSAAERHSLIKLVSTARCTPSTRRLLDDINEFCVVYATCRQKPI